MKTKYTKNLSAEDLKEQKRLAIEKSIERKINELKEMQLKKVKFQHMQGLKEEIYRLKRMLSNLN